MNSATAMLFALKRYALHDGPHIRTTLFFKGCPLNCFWCHNPEGISSHIEVISVSDRCIGCSECLHGCPETALTLKAQQEIIRDQDRCTTCLNCVEICPALAHEALGYYSDQDLIMAEIEKDLPFYDQSGGGVTFSGGEPLMQPQPLLSLLKRCGELDIHRAVDTSGYAASDTIVEVARHTELFLYDLKHMDCKIHQQITGVPNTRILHNLELLADLDVELRIRIPLLATINDEADNIHNIGVFATRMDNLQGIDLLPYHRYANTKYAKLGSACTDNSRYTPDKDAIGRTQQILEQYGHAVTIGG